MCVQLFSCQFFFFKSLGCQISIINLVRLFLRSLDSVTFSQHEALTDLTWHWSNLSKKASLGRRYLPHIWYQDTNSQIRKCTNTQIHKYAINTQCIIDIHVSVQLQLQPPIYVCIHKSTRIYYPNNKQRCTIYKCQLNK